MCLEFGLFMKSLILNEIYIASLLYNLFLSCYICKYVIIIYKNWGGYGKSPSDEESPSLTHFYLCRDGDGDGDGFESGDGEGKAIPVSASPRPVAIPIHIPLDACFAFTENVPKSKLYI